MIFNKIGSHTAQPFAS